VIIEPDSIWITDAPKLKPVVKVTRSNTSHVYYKAVDKRGEHHWDKAFFLRYYRRRDEVD